MEHFETRDWVDFARNTCDSERKDLMNAHLQEGCHRCSEELMAWMQFVSWSTQEIAYEPPPGVLRLVKTALAPIHPQSTVSRVQEVAQLVFDSLLRPPTYGVRASLPGKRHLIYRHDSMMIELSVEPGTGSEESLLVGQITDYKTPRTQSLAISVIRNSKLIAETRTNGLGEFFVEFKRQPDTWISFHIDATRDVVIPMGETLTGSA